MQINVAGLSSRSDVVRRLGCGSLGVSAVPQEATDLVTLHLFNRVWRKPMPTCESLETECRGGPKARTEIGREHQARDSITTLPIAI